jgi:stringent starvation protein B
VPIDHVIAIYARENGQGMAFPMPSDGGSGDAAEPGKVEAPAAAPRGPRLAGSSGIATRKGTALTLSPSPAPGGATRSGAEPPGEPPPTEPPPPKRPSLKRVK